MSGRPRIDSISNYDDFWLASAARNATGGDVDMPNVDGNVAAMKPDPVDVGAGDGRLDVHGENGDTRRPTIRSDSLTDDKMSKLTPNLTPSLMAHTYFNDISPLSKPLLPSSAHAEGQLHMMLVSAVCDAKQLWNAPCNSPFLVQRAIVLRQVCATHFRVRRLNFWLFLWRL
jgi:hypothetical protein